MTNLNFPILKFQHADATAFVEFWNRQYSYGKEHHYDDNIGKPITEDSLLALFEWKNGSVLSAKKKRSIEQYLLASERVDQSIDKDSLRRFLCRPGGAIWRIYWLHIQHPNRFPIYDQHVHRAMASLKGISEIEIPKKDARKVDCYVDEYLPFVASLGKMPIRKLDRALWAYGRFLSLQYDVLSP